MVDKEGFIANILYQPTVEEIQGRTADILTGMIWLSPTVAESLLKLNNSSLSPCTYMGADSGEETLQMSLYYDILPAAATGGSKEEFLLGKCGKTLSRGRSDGSNKAMMSARKLVWQEMRRYRMTVSSLPGLAHKYLAVTGSLGQSELMSGWREVGEMGLSLIHI